MRNHCVESSTREGGFCLGSFNRRVIENRRVESLTREGGFCLCRRGFNRRVDGKSSGDWKPIPIQESLIFGGGEQPDF